MYLKDTYEDFKYLNDLPGKKLLLKGNHDYWWTTVTSMRKYIKENNFKNIDFIYNNAYTFENYIIAGTRGWGQNEEGETEKIFKREALRLELSLQEAKKMQEENEKEIIVFMHYPPINKSEIIKNETNDFIRIMKKYEVKRCYYGHLHGVSIRDAIEGNYMGINFRLVSADKLNFKLEKIGEINGRFK